MARFIVQGCHRFLGFAYHHAERRFEFISLWADPVFLLFTMPRINGHGCGIVAIEEVPWNDDKRIPTKTYMLFLACWRLFT